jgi:hypothetical protein
MLVGPYIRYCPHILPAYKARMYGPHVRPAYTARMYGPHVRTLGVGVLVGVVVEARPRRPEAQDEVAQQLRPSRPDTRQEMIRKRLE